MLSSDASPAVFALFRAEVRIIDHAKRASLQKMLLESVTSTSPGEKLDEKLANLTFSPEEHDRESSHPWLFDASDSLFVSSTPEL